MTRNDYYQIDIQEWKLRKYIMIKLMKAEYNYALIRIWCRTTYTMHCTFCKIPSSHFYFSLLDIKFVCASTSRVVIVTCEGHDYMIIQQTNLSYCTFFLQFSHRLLFYAKDNDI